MGNLNESGVERRRAKRLVKAFEAAVDNLAFKGSMHPDDHDEIDRAYEKTKQALLDFMLARPSTATTTDKV